ncbi:Endonuclease/Exonuclease/phosphatase family protein [Maioricimonas rarisocia]|uniref:Endonuclease/Exonuclease/phosphatase family protein n=1 Tax=Maioricimonas rarisocia TaxID=2528026 RepID=A0A517Z654_9PLAN|nr:endonuclease/exonuclease/phosphatase family protein [Maioricimonas rarisocia]QDU37935.1 Endonuclease/Exonuclease/phosphatase family protein [Maioricimonas rarisocia]
MAPSASNESPHPTAGRHVIWLRRLFSLVVLGLMLVTTIGWFGQYSYLADLTAHFRLQYLLLAVPLTLLLASMRQWKSASAGLAVVLINAGCIAPLFGTSPASVTAGTTPLKVIAVNVHVMNRNHAPLQEWVRSEQPDVIIVSELSTAWSTAMDELSDLLPHQFERLDNGNGGLGLYSRFPIEESEWHLLGDVNYAGRIRITVDGVPVTLFGVHTYAPFHRWMSEMRDYQFGQLADLVNQTDTRVIVAGDLNATTWSAGLKQMLAATGLIDTRVGFGLQPTWPDAAWPLRIAIDHCLVSDGITTVDRQVGPAIGSDHFPIVADLRLPSVE